jgi:predicted nucleotidyltransferase
MASEGMEQRGADSVPDPLMAVVRRLATSPAVAAIALVGSHASGMAEPDSDLDLFVYADGDLGTLRAEMAHEHADPAAWHSLHERGFGDCDTWRLKDGRSWLDLMYWPTTWAEEQLHRVLAEHTASMGYSTAFWRSIRDARPLYQRDGWHADLQRRARQPYPESLRRNVVNLNRPYLRDHPFSFREQAAKAIARQDLVSVNHRVAAWLASYADIVFALNRVLHPGEKRLPQHLSLECDTLPADLLPSVSRLVGLAGQASPSILAAMDELTDALEAVLRREGLIAE